MRKTAALLAAMALLSGASVLAAQPAGAEPAPASETAMDMDLASAKAQTVATKTVHYTHLGPYFLRPVSLSGKASYVPALGASELNAPEAKARTGKALLGQLRVTGKDVTASAFIYNEALQSPKTAASDEEDVLAELFNGSKEGKENIDLYNEFVPAFSYMINEEVQESIARKNKKDKTAIPEDVFHFSLNDFKKLQPFGKDGYSTSGRIVATVDGWVIPLYAKAYILKHGDTYRLLAGVTSDPSRDMISPALDSLAEQAKTI